MTRPNSRTVVLLCICARVHDACIYRARGLASRDQLQLVCVSEMKSKLYYQIGCWCLTEPRVLLVLPAFFVVVVSSLREGTIGSPMVPTNNNQHPTTLNNSAPPRQPGTPRACPTLHMLSLRNRPCRSLPEDLDLTLKFLDD